ncbi:hypothetical protein TrST_g8153 [Triparma strigata]|uniref:Uncharacterized protein n=1 Tax=Triparma strigata TaxID=1606541 RepID=A0A9W7EH82_9STRA|nr:hypothetical protein TrST_g8153 [Triparma strigata]
MNPPAPRQPVSPDVGGPDDIIKTEEFNLSAHRAAEGFMRTGSAPLKQPPIRHAETGSVDTTTTLSSREVSWRTTVTEKDVEKNEANLRKLEKIIKHRQQDIQAELLGFFGEEADGIQIQDSDSSTSSCEDESDAESSSDSELEDLSLPSNPSAAKGIVAELRNERQPQAPSPRTAHKLYMMNQPMPGQKSIPKKKKRGGHNASRKFSITAALSKGNGRAGKGASEMWYSLNGGSKVPALEAMAQHDLSLQKAGVGRKDKPDKMGSVKNVNEVSRRFRHISEVFPAFSVLHTHLGKQARHQGFETKPYVENLALRRDSAANPWTLHSKGSIDADKRQRADSQKEFGDKMQRKMTLFDKDGEAGRTTFGERSSDASFLRFSDLSAGSGKSQSSPRLLPPKPSLLKLKEKLKEPPKVKGSVPKKPPPPPSSMPPPKPAKKLKPSPHAVAITLSFMYNKSIKLRPYEPLPSPGAKTNKTRSRLSIAAANGAGAAAKAHSMKTIPRHVPMPVMSAPPRPPAPPTPPAPPRKEVPIPPKPVFPVEKPKRILNRLPSSIPPPPPDEEEVVDTEEQRRVAGLSSKVIATETFRLSGGSERDNNSISSGGPISSSSSSSRPISVVQSGLAPTAPPPPTPPAPESFSRDVHDGANIVETEEFKLSGGSKAELEGEAGAKKNVRASVKVLGLVPEAPLPPTPLDEEAKIEVEVEVEAEAEAEEENEEEDVVEDEMEVVGRIRAETMSKEMKKAVESQIRRGSVIDEYEPMCKQKGLSGREILELFHQKNHSRFSMLRMSTGTEFGDEDEEEYDDEDYDDEDYGDDDQEQEEEEEEEEEQSGGGGDGDSSFMLNSFMYNMGPEEEEENEGRPISAVISKPRTLTIIKKEEDDIQDEVEQREESRVSMEAFLSGKGGIPAPPIEDISAPSNFSHQRGLAAPSASSSRPRMRERDLSDTEFYYVYGLTRQQFKKLGILKRAWLRSENMHRRPYLEPTKKTEED